MDQLDGQANSGTHSSRVNCYLSHRGQHGPRAFSIKIDMYLEQSTNSFHIELKKGPGIFYDRLCFLHFVYIFYCIIITQDPMFLISSIWLGMCV